MLIFLIIRNTFFIKYFVGKNKEKKNCEKIGEEATMTSQH